METKTEIPAYCVWRAMRKDTKRPISQEAIEVMLRYIIESIKDTTQKAVAIQSDLNKRLPERMHRKRIDRELILEALDANE